MPDSSDTRLKTTKGSGDRLDVDVEGFPSRRRADLSKVPAALLHTPPSLFPGVLGNSFKRPRTTSPPTSTEENGSDTEGEVPAAATPSSESECSRDRREEREGSPHSSTLSQPATAAVSGHSHQQHHSATPLRFSFGCASATETKMSNSDPTNKAAVDGLLTERMLNITDRDAATGVVGLPSYSQAIGQSVQVSTHADSEEIHSSVMPSAVKPDGREQLERVKTLMEKPLQLNHSWFAVATSWFQRWANACSEVSQSVEEEVEMIRVGEIAQEQLGRYMLRPGLEEGTDFELVPREAWDLLVAWYGRQEAPIERKVINMPSSDTLRIELHPPALHISCVGERTSTFSAVFSVTQTLRDLKVAATEHLGGGQLTSEMQDELDLRFWRLPLDQAGKDCTIQTLQSPGVELISSDKDEGLTLAELQLDQPVELLALEVKKSVSDWPSDEQKTSLKGIFKQDGGDFLSKMQTRKSSTPEPSASASASSSARVTRSQTAADRGMEKQRGLTGLYNLGNTCFMNAALQCMSNTKELKDYFVSGVYKSEVNVENPLGMGGAMAKVFGELLSKLWTSGGGAWHPREFKTVLSRFSPQFIGYAQQDTQELLAFLLDGLHEDLNRIVKKPYIEAPDWEGGGIKEMVAFAHKQWEIYKLRNDSVIVDLFQGQYRSTLVCPDCGKVSIKFDPFMYLTLPIPNRKPYKRTVLYVPWDDKQMVTEVEMRFTAETSIGQLKKNLAEWFKSDPGRMVACDVFSKTFYRVYGDFEHATDIGVNDVTFVYELPGPLKPLAGLASKSNSYFRRERLEEMEASSQFNDAGVADDTALLPVFSLFKGARQQSNYYNRGGGTAFGQPFFVAIAKDSLNDEEAVQRAVLNKYAQYATSQPALQHYLEELDEAKSPQEDWDMLNETASSVVLPDTAHGDEETTVAEIYNGGETVHLVPDAAKPQRDIVKGASKEEKKAAYSLHYIVHREDQSPITLKPEGYEEYGEELHKRANRFGLKPDEGYSQMETDQEGDMVRVPSQAEAKRRADWPLVYTGGALVCVWSEEAKEKVFGDDDEGWGGGPSRPRFIDPELVAERKADVGEKKLKATITIEDCLNEFTREEQLGESDPWYCPQCKDFKQATKKFDLWKVPDILVVHLKRFSSGRISRDKIDSFIDFPVHGLDLTERVEGAKAVAQLFAEDDDDDEDKLMESIGSLGADDDAVESDTPVYDLYAVDNHYGGLGGGHYTAYAKNPEDERWYYFDDSSVRAVENADEVKGRAAYLLFYRRRTTRPIGGKSRDKVREKVKVEQEGATGSSGPALATRSQAGPSGELEEGTEASGETPGGHNAKLAEHDETAWGDSYDNMPSAGPHYSGGWVAVMEGPTRRGLLSSDGSAAASLGDADSSFEADGSGVSNLSQTLDNGDRASPNQGAESNRPVSPL